MRNRRPNYETDDETFSAEAYTAEGWGSGIAWRVYGWEVEETEQWWEDEDGPEDEDGNRPSYCEMVEGRSGRIVAVMVGDDRRFTFEPDDLTPLAREDYCGQCGQVGCGHDGLDRSETE